MLDAAFLARKFAAALPYADYVRTGTPDQQLRWKQVLDAATLSDCQANLVKSFPRVMKVLTISGIWCGDCIQQCPLIERIAQANPASVQHRLIDRDEHRDLSKLFPVNAGDRVPVVLLLAEDHEFCASFGDRTLRRYRAILRRHFGPSCPIAIVPPDPDELAATLTDWLDEIERVQLMLRLSPRLRQKHGD
jgi:thiol-disulfide isomerase/thioredoxin